MDSKVKEIEPVFLLRIFLKKKRVIIKICLVFLGIGILIAFFTENKYTAETTFVPVIGEGISKDVTGLAAVAGINLGGPDNSKLISPNLYPKVLFSQPILNSLIKSPLKDNNLKEVITYERYYLDYYKGSFFDLLKKYTLGLPSLLFKKKKEGAGSLSIIENDIINTTYDEYYLYERLKKQLTIDVSNTDGLIKLKCTSHSKLISAQVLEKARELLQEAIITFKINKLKGELLFLEEQLKIGEEHFKREQNKLSLFKDRNRDLSTNVSRNSLLRLESSYNLSYEIYSKLAKEVSSKKIEIKENTPVFTVVDPVVIPSFKSGPKRLVIIFFSFFFGLIISCLYVFWRPIIKFFLIGNLKRSDF